MKTFIICVRLKYAENIPEYYAGIYDTLRRGAEARHLRITSDVELKHGKLPLPQGFFKAKGTGSIDELNALASSAARLGTPAFVAVFQITDSPESIRLSYPDRVTARKTKRRTLSP
jgi:hypothetical protein